MYVLDFRRTFLKLHYPRTAILFVITLLAALAGCSGLTPGYEQPTVTVNSFRAIPSDGAIPDFIIGLRVVNPNRQSLALEGASYSISLEGHEIIKGVANELPVIDAYGEGTFTLTASANLFAGMRLVSELLRTPKDSFAYEFEAKLDPGGFRRAIRIRDAGRVSLAGAAN